MLKKIIHAARALVRVVRTLLQPVPPSDMQSLADSERDASFAWDHYPKEAPFPLSKRKEGGPS